MDVIEEMRGITRLTVSTTESTSDASNACKTGDLWSSDVMLVFPDLPLEMSWGNHSEYVKLRREFVIKLDREAYMREVQRGPTHLPVIFSAKCMKKKTVRHQFKI